MLHYKRDLLILTSSYQILQGSVFCMFCFAFNLEMMLISVPCLVYADWSMFSMCSFLFANKPSCWGAPKITQL